MTRQFLVVLILLMLPAALLAQAPAQAPAAPPQAPPAAAPRPAAPAAAATGASKVAVVDFQRALTENVEGKKAQESFLAEITKRQGDFDKKQKSLDDAQNKLRTQGTVLDDTAKANLSKTIDQTTTELNRMNEDAQKELGDLQQKLFRPIAERTQKVLQAYASETGFGVVFDVSSQANSIIYYPDVADITTEIIRRVDAEAARPAPARPAEPAKK
ncbi:MAG TPA: OmpH family outer membrane protein [Terriglobia bacterium]|nr:OmpH family outer membrane protein [Terriglobia bacterium]